MRILYTYLFGSSLAALTFTTSGLLCLWLIIDLFDSLYDFLQYQPNAVELVQYYALQLPKSAQLVVPMAFVLSILFVLGTMSKNREIIVIQAAGISLFRIVWPFLLLGAGMAALLLYFNISLSPRSEVERRIIRERLKGVEQHSLVFRGVIYRGQDGKSMWYIHEIDANAQTMKQAEILVRNEKGRDLYKLFAAQGTYREGFWDLINVRRIDFDPDGSAKKPVELTQLNALNLTDTPKQIIATLRSPDELDWFELLDLVYTPKPLSPSIMAPFITEHFYRMAYPSLVFILGLYAVAMGINTSRRDAIASLFGTILVLLAFLAWMRFSSALGAGNRIHPFLAAWNGPLLFATVGLALFLNRMGWLWPVWQTLDKQKNRFIN